MKSPVVSAPRKLRVLYVSDGGARVHALTQVLEHRGHQVVEVNGLRGILPAGECQVLVLDTGDGQPDDALRGLTRVLREGPGVPIVLVVPGPNYELCFSAGSHGVANVVQTAFDPRALTDAVEKAVSDHSPSTPAVMEHSARYHTALCHIDQTIEDLCAFLENTEVAAPHRARIACAAAGLVENVHQHAYPATPGGEYTLRIALRGAYARLEISDDGVGMDSKTAHLESVPAALPRARSGGRRPHPSAALGQGTFRAGGLAKAARLAEHFAIQGKGGGTRVELEFELTPVRFEASVFPSAAAFRPRHVRSLLASIEAGEVCIENIPAALACTVRRLIDLHIVRPPAIKKA